MGALNVYAEHPHAFDQSSKDIGLVFAAHSSVAWNSARRDEQFKRALASRDVIGQAKGMIMERYGVDAVQAFEVLRKLSQDSNVPLVQVATELVSKGGEQLAASAVAPIAGRRWMRAESPCDSDQSARYANAEQRRQTHRRRRGHRGFDRISKWHCGSRRSLRRWRCRSRHRLATCTAGTGGAGQRGLARRGPSCLAARLDSCRRPAPCRIHSLWPKRDGSLTELLRRTYTSKSVTALLRSIDTVVISKESEAMRGVVLCVLAAIGINAIVAAGPASASMAAANQSYKPAAAADQPYEARHCFGATNAGRGRGCGAPRGGDVQRARRRQARGRARH